VATVEAGEVQVEVALDLVGVLLAPVAEVYGEVAMSSSSVTPASEG
jgi:inorganic triphosphatase YgiF